MDDYDQQHVLRGTFPNRRYHLVRVTRRTSRVPGHSIWRHIVRERMYVTTPRSRLHQHRFPRLDHRQHWRLKQNLRIPNTHRVYFLDLAT
ncbi:hypothetical protein HF086_009743 [Spodoptera exigua]|uniref:Uncharacterized protein n=1 Tax=Spodoptera exigua TaxID=7107 RepID=A0A922MCP0_SPOEX|nr:hypothetical protein HF086_009743 [Spodoptera exigua]